MPRVRWVQLSFVVTPTDARMWPVLIATPRAVRRQLILRPPRLSWILCLADCDYGAEVPALGASGTFTGDVERRDALPIYLRDGPGSCGGCGTDDTLVALFRLGPAGSSRHITATTRGLTGVDTVLFARIAADANGEQLTSLHAGLCLLVRIQNTIPVQVNH